MTHLDLCSAYNQVRMSDDGPQDDAIAAATFQGLTPNGGSCLNEMLAVGFGLCNAFSLPIINVLEHYISNFVVVYLDDICIFSEAHEQHLGLILQNIREHQLFIKMPKYF